MRGHIGVWDIYAHTYVCVCSDIHVCVCRYATASSKSHIFAENHIFTGVL